MKLRLFGAAFAAWVTFNSANATVYNINEVINVASSVVGTLTTDGFIGSLTDPTHIVDWNLTVTANTVSGNLFGPSSGNNSTVYFPGWAPRWLPLRQISLLISYR